MRLVVEVGIDIDEKRRIWITGQVPDDLTPEEFNEVAPGLTKSVMDQALRAHEVAGVRAIPPSGADVLTRAGLDPRAPSERPKRPEDPATMLAFGEDGDEPPEEQ